MSPKRDRTAMVPDAEFRSYYGQPVLKEPVWKWQIPAYFFTGGLAGASSMLGAGARLTGNVRLARVAERTALANILVSPVFLIADLGVRRRFPNMLRVARPTSPMNVGSWVLSLYGPAAGAAAVLDGLGWFPRLRAMAEAGAAALGPVMTTYTAVLVADTAIPAWHDARGELPFAFAGSALATAGAVGVLFVAPEDAGPARRAMLAGAAVEGTAMATMERRLGDAAEAYRTGEAGPWTKASKVLFAAGTALALAGRRRRWISRIGAAMVVAAGVSERMSVFKAGFESARDPKYTVVPQRDRVVSGGAAVG